MHAVPVRSLPPRLHRLWRSLADDGSTVSPFLHPEYARLVGEVRPDVEVGVITEGSDPVGFLPFQRSRMGVGSPVGGRLCDLSGALVRSDATWCPERLTKGLGLRSLRMACVPSAMQAFAPYTGPTVPSRLLDLSDGYEAFRQDVDSESSVLKQTERKARKLERDVGPIRFEWHNPESAVFEKLVEWKAAQRKATGTPDVLSLPWVQPFLDRLRRHDSGNFAGVLSTLWVGDELAAAHLGMRSRHVLHYWLPAYSAEYARYSPGLITLLRMAEAAADRGILRIDLGPGQERYKTRMGTRAMDVSTVTVNASVTARVVTGAVDHLKAWSRDSPFAGAIRTARRRMTRAAYHVRAALSTTESMPPDRS